MEKRLLGDYSIIKQIGGGPLGMVYLAEHRFIKRHFILKVLPEELATDRSFVSRFEKEVSSLSVLEHPHLVKLHNISFADGNYFFVTDCIVDHLGETTTLAQYLSHHEKISEKEVFSILSQIADALDYAHQKQVDGAYLTHRSLKLNNILLGTGEQKPHVMLSDFGLAKVVGEGMILTRTYKILASSLGITVDSATLGAPEKYLSENIESGRLSKLHQSFLQTFQFLAPEQKIANKQQQIGPEADVYAFGVLMYYLLMNVFPEGAFPMPSTLNLKAYPWDDMIRACLQPDPSKRPKVLMQMLNQLPESTPAKVLKEALVTAEAKAPEPVALAAPVISTESPKPLLNPGEIARPTYEADPGAIFHMEHTVAHYKPAPQEIKEVEPLLTDMVVIEGGKYMRGNTEGGRDEKPFHEIRLDSFALDIHPVTNEQFVRFIQVMGGEKDSNNNDIIRLRESRIRKTGGKLTIESGYAKHPVTSVTWYGAVAYAKWVGKRLPTEAEWEVAAQGNTPEFIYPTGVNVERNQANFFSSDTIAVMSYPPNPYGLHDMAGNVYEWCQDWYDYNYYETSNLEPENPKGPVQGVYRVLRGGCWKSLKEDLRCSHRHRNNPGIINKTYGFRLAADAT